MSGLDDFDIRKGSYIVIMDPKEENKIMAEGEVLDFKEIAGTDRVRIILDPPLWIEATRVEE